MSNSSLALVIDNADVSYFQTPDEIKKEFEISAKAIIEQSGHCAEYDYTFANYASNFKGSLSV